MNGVKDDGHPGAMRGQAGQNAGFAAVRVDNARRGGAEHFDQPPPGQISTTVMSGLRPKKVSVCSGWR